MIYFHSKYNFLIAKISIYVCISGALLIVFLGLFGELPEIGLYLLGCGAFIFYLSGSCPCCRESLWNQYRAFDLIDGCIFNFNLIFGEIECRKCGFKGLVFKPKTSSVEENKRDAADDEE